MQLHRAFIAMAPEADAPLRSTVDTGKGRSASMPSAGSPRTSGFRFVAALVSFVALLHAPLVPAQDGRAPYTPTTLEWLSIWAQARMGGDKVGHSIIVSPREPRTIRVSVAYFRLGTREDARRSLDHVVREIRDEAKFRGWLWLEIEESLQDHTR